MMKPKTRDDLGLALTMLDSDRLRQWAEKIDTHGRDISNGSDPRFVSEQLRAIAGRIEATVREVGTLRDMAGVSEESRDVVTRITSYLSNGGFFNPELMEHDKVRRLLMDCRDALTGGD